MFEPLGAPDFLVAARKEGKRFSALRIFLLFLLVLFIGNFLSSILTTPILWAVMLTDPDYYALVEQAAANGDMNVFLEQLLVYEQGLYQKPLFLIGMLFSTLATTAAALVFCKCIERRSLFSMGLGKKGAVGAYLRGLLLGLVLLAAALGFCLLFGGYTAIGVGIYLLHIVAAHYDIRTCDSIARSGMLCKEAKFRDCLLALNPTRNRHRILLDELCVDELLASTSL